MTIIYYIIFHSKVFRQWVHRHNRQTENKCNKCPENYSPFKILDLHNTKHDKNLNQCPYIHRIGNKTAIHCIYLGEPEEQVCKLFVNASLSVTISTIIV